MKKLMKCEIDIKVKGKYYGLFGKEKEVEALFYILRNIICEDKNKEKIAEKIVKEYKKGLEEKIEEDKKVELVDYDSPFFSEKLFNEITDIEILRYYIREATIKEVIEELSPSEYAKVYGNILKLEKEV